MIGQAQQQLAAGIIRLIGDTAKIADQKQQRTGPGQALKS